MCFQKKKTFPNFFFTAQFNETTLPESWWDRVELLRRLLKAEYKASRSLYAYPDWYQATYQGDKEKKFALLRRVGIQASEKNVNKLKGAYGQLNVAICDDETWDLLESYNKAHFEAAKAEWVKTAMRARKRGKEPAPFKFKWPIAARHVLALFKKAISVNARVALLKRLSDTTNQIKVND